MKRLACLLTLFAVVAFVGRASAETISVTTSDDGATSYTVADPDFGDYTVDISGQSGKTEQEGVYRFRTGSTRGSVTQTWNMAVSGLNPIAEITDFTMHTARIVPTVGGGSGWDWTIDLSAPLTGGGTFTDTRTLVGDTRVAPPLQFTAPEGDSFGNSPVFQVTVSKSNSNTRSIGWNDFTITAVPEPGTWLLLLSALACGLLVRRRRTG